VQHRNEWLRADVTGETAVFSPEECVELLDLAEKAGRGGVLEWMVQNGTVRLSLRCMAIYGLDHFDGRHETWIKGIHPDDRPEVHDLVIQGFAEHAESIDAEFRIIRPNDGALRWIQARRLAFYDADGKPFRVVGVSVDVTEHKRATARSRAFTRHLEQAVRERTAQLEAEYDARRKAEDSLRQAQKMEAVGQLTGGVAHDFNNLLTIILGGLEAIGRQLPALDASPAVERIERSRDMAIQGTKRAATLTSRLLAFSRQQALAPQSLNPNKLVADISEILRRTLGETIELETVLAGGLWPAFADANQLENAILNLAVNARDAMPKGGKMTIETANSYLDESYVTTLSEPVEPGQYVMIAVADTGVGMERAALERAFEPFFTTKEAGRGTGLGLSQVYGFVRQSSGHVRIYSELGEGTTVKLYLPRVAATDEVAPETRLPANANRAIGSETVLVVEDDEALRTYAVETLSELGYHVVEAGDGAAALAALTASPGIDLLFTDIVMPGGVNGRQLADEAQRRHPDLKVLFTTGYTRNAIIHHGRLDPGVSLIGKPYSYEELGGAVRAMLDGVPYRPQR
jgi:PAS domain S-box-containing protein